MKQNSYKIDLEIYIVFIVVIGISVFNAVYSALNISKNQQATTKIMTVDIPSLQSLENMNLLVTRSKMYTTNWVYLPGNREDKERLKSLQNVEYPELKGNILALASTWEEPGMVDSVNAIFRRFEQVLVYQRQVMNLLVSFDDYEDPMKHFAAEEVIDNEILPRTNDIIGSLNKVIVQKRSLAEFEYTEMMAASRALMWSVLGIAILIVIVVLMAAFYMSNSIIVPTMKLKNYVLQMGKGEIPEVELRQRKNAVGQMNEAVIKLAESLKKTTGFAHAIGEGNFEEQFEPLSEKDELGNALVQMRDSLRRADEENRQRHWTSAGIAQINRTLREHGEDIHRLSDELVSSIVGHLEAHHGALYLVEKDDLRNASWIQLLGSYALDGRTKAKPQLELGEGLIGQCIKDKKSIWLKDAPVHFARIQSGLGDAHASHVVIVPLTYHGQAFGAVEVASFRAFDTHTVSFLEGIGELIASSFASVQANMLTRKLLDETRKQAERLAAQEEELRQTNDELSNQSRLLQASEEELKQSNLELKENTRVLEQQNEILEQAREALSLKARELEQNSKYKSEFLANMSHELRTPLNSVLILAKLLSENKDANLSDKQIEYARVIHKSGSDLLVLINDILDLSKIEAGKVELLLEQTELRTIREDLRSLFIEVANEKKIEFELEQETNLPVAIVTDRVRLEQVIKNMLSNAFKFTPQGGKVTLRVRRPDRNVRFTNPALMKSREVIEFSVTDTGIGIPQEKQQLIFEAFQQVDGSTSRRYGGTGLGLSISKMLVSMLGGEMRLVSEQGKGSTFYVYLPFESVAPTKEDVPAGDAQPLTSPVSVREIPESFISVPDDRHEIRQGDRVLLIVEDDVQFASILVDMAHEHRYKAVVATQGDQGLQLAEDLRPSAIIMDMQLPGMDGWSVLKKIRANDRLAGIPVHVMSAMDRKNLGMELGASAYLRKPLDKVDLEQAFGAIDATVRDTTRRVLLIEDESIQQEIVSSLLEGKNFRSEVTSVATTNEAWKALSDGSYDCVILDLDLGNGPRDGIDFLEDLKNRSEFRNVPVIVFTGTEIDADQEQSIRKHNATIVMKDGEAFNRLLQETEQFLHQVEDEQAATTQARVPERMNELLKGRKVLLVDDDMRNIYAMTSVLEDQGMDVIPAVNGREAIALLQQRSDIDIVLMDIMMPEMDGYEAMTEIRKVDQWKTLPIIALTAKAMIGDREKCLQHGATDYISKPVNTDQLLSLLQVWLYKQ
jgi:CheY-like chemotaxis protein/putative methionine-R-sulfoxide reductase with GAF domain